MSKLRKLFLGLGVIGGTIYYLNAFDVEPNFASNLKNISNSKWDDNWDRRSPNDIENTNGIKNQNPANQDFMNVHPTATRHIILVRHGQYNKDAHVEKDRHLTKVGKTQAQYTGQRLKALGFPYSLMVKSTMARAQETGAIINSFLSGIEIKDCDLIREGAPVPPDPPVAFWNANKHQFYQDGARIEAAFREYFHRADLDQENDSYTILVCHANVIRYFVCRALQFPAEAWLRFSLKHGSITWITITPSGKVILEQLGDTGHMPVEIITN